MVKRPNKNRAQRPRRHPGYGMCFQAECPICLLHRLQLAPTNYLNLQFATHDGELFVGTYVGSWMGLLRSHGVTPRSCYIGNYELWPVQQIFLFPTICLTVSDLAVLKPSRAGARRTRDKTPPAEVVSHSA
jgi:hypothetical protein